LIQNTTSDLEEHLQQITQKLQDLSSQRLRSPDEDDTERNQIQDERDSTLQCLDICARVSSHIDQIQSKAFHNVSLPAEDIRLRMQTLNLPVPAQILAVNALTQCKVNLGEATSELSRRLQNVEERLQNAACGASQTPDISAAEKDTLLEEIESAKQCLALCAQASDKAEPSRINIFEDVSMAADGRQVIVSTLGDLISAKRITAGDRSMQLMGQMSDHALEQFACDRHLNQTEGDVERHNPAEPNLRFERYGTGQKLSVSNLRDTTGQPR
jgi:hypothetical protein